MMYNLKPGALKKGQGGQEEWEGNKRADGWQVWWGFGDSRIETLATEGFNVVFLIAHNKPTNRKAYRSNRIQMSYKIRHIPF